MHFHQYFSLPLFALSTGLVAQAVAGAGATTVSPSVAASAPRPPGKCEAPSYPPEAQRAGQQGTTKIRFTVDPEGAVVAAEVRVSSGFESLDQAAVQTLSACRFKPRVEAGVPMSTTVNVEYVWKIE